MALIAEKLEGKWVTLKCDPATKEDEKTFFRIAPLSHREYAVIQNKYIYNQDGKTHFGGIEQSIDAISKGLKEVKNLVDENGNDITFQLEKVRVSGAEVERVPLSFINVLPRNVLYELGAVISRENTLTEEEKESLNSSNPE